MAETIQTYILMHKEIPVAEIRLDSVTVSVSAVGEIFARAQALCKALCRRVERLTVVNSRRKLYPVDDRYADVTEDVAYCGADMER